MDYITVRVGCLPGAIREIALNGDRTVQAALEAAELSPEGYEVRVDGEPARLSDEVYDDATILLVRKVTGN